MDSLHATLKRQLKRLGINSRQELPTSEQWQSLLDKINTTYHGIDQERYLSERSIAVSTREMEQLNKNLTEERDRLALMTEELKQGKQELKKHADQLERSNEHLRRFAFVASHDLQEPLRKIATISSYIITECRETVDDDIENMLMRLQASVERMRRLIDGILAFSGLKTEKLEYSKVQLNDLLDNVIDDLMVPLHESGAQIDIQSEMPAVKGSETYLYQLFLNLIGNAVKFRHKDRVLSLKITSRLSLRDTFVEVVVADNGIGIEETQMERVFQVFHRLHGMDEFEGHGLGLAICREIVEMHGGKINVESVLGENTSFILTLPVFLD